MFLSLYLKTAKVQRNLKCYYWTNFNRPELIIGPVKIEELWNSPHLIRFLDIYTDDEIDVIKSLAKPRVFKYEFVHQHSIMNLIVFN